MTLISLFALIAVVDVFLIATVLFVVAVSLYEMFIGDLKLPEWMVAHNLYELKSKLSGVIILVMAMKFLEKLVDWKAPQDTSCILRYRLPSSLLRW